MESVHIAPDTLPCDADLVRGDAIADPSYRSPARPSLDTQGSTQPTTSLEHLPEGLVPPSIPPSRATTWQPEADEDIGTTEGGLASTPVPLNVPAHAGAFDPIRPFGRAPEYIFGRTEPGQYPAPIYPPPSMWPTPVGTESIAGPTIGHPPMSSVMSAATRYQMTQRRDQEVAEATVTPMSAGDILTAQDSRDSSRAPSPISPLPSSRNRLPGDPELVTRAASPSGYRGLAKLIEKIADKLDRLITTTERNARQIDRLGSRIEEVATSSKAYVDEQVRAMENRLTAAFKRGGRGGDSSSTQVLVPPQGQAAGGTPMSRPPPLRLRRRD